jgi:hypothetical protein
MSLRDTIQSQCRAAISALAPDVSWSYKQRTSADDAETPTYDASWTDIDAHLARTTDEEAFDGERDDRRTTRTVEIRTGDAVSLDVGDLLSPDSGTTTYIIDAVQSTGVGTRLYRATLTTHLLADPGRGGSL